MTKPLLVEPFCGSGDATPGYAKAGFRTLGVDRLWQPHYPGAFLQADVMADPIARIVEASGAVAVSATPPRHLLDDVRELLFEVQQHLGVAVVIQRNLTAAHAEVIGRHLLRAWEAA